ncbi:MAG: 2-amino-4-hydroxy-6-hydroxymethyldihydropteridine diphosphokinase [Rhizobiaceae bacterium]
MSSQSIKAWLGLGGNVGDVQSAMGVALRGLEAHKKITITNVSSIYKTEPWGLKNQPWFHNCCAEIEAQLSPLALLEVTQAVEKVGKRERVIRWGPRTIDVDILSIDGVELSGSRLTIPHPRMVERAFVLIPLAEIEDSLVIEGQTVAERAKAIDSSGVVQIKTMKNWWQ